MFEVQWTRIARGELGQLPAHQRARIYDEIDEFLVPSANVEAPPKRKQIRGLRPPWSQIPVPFWQLRVDPYRVFYVIDAASPVAVIMAIRLKPRGRRTEDIL